MAVGATASQDLAYAWGHTVGQEGRRLGLDVTWSPVLDVNTNPDNPIINVRSFGEDPEMVARLGAAMTRGIQEGGLHACAKHWPGHGDVAVDSHIALAHLPLTRERLSAIEWRPYRRAVAAGLESVMTGHLLVPAIDPENCTTVSPTLIRILREDLGMRGCLFTDSLGMEGLRQTLDSAEAAWRALAAGHDQVLIDYKRPPQESVEAVVAACMDGRVPEARLRDAVARVHALKARRAALPPAPADDAIRAEMAAAGRKIAEASLTLCGTLEGGLDLGARPLLVICDDLQRRGAGIAEEKEGEGIQGTHPLARALRAKTPFDVLVFSETPTEADMDRLETALNDATAVVGATFARIFCYKGDGSRLPEDQELLWRALHMMGHLRAMMLFESPYALDDLPRGVPAIVGYGADAFTLNAAAEGLLGERPCPGRLPVTVGRA